MSSNHFTQILNQHLIYSAQIIKWIDIRDHLINEMQAKKATVVRKRYRFIKETQTIYFNILFLGQRRISSFDSWPSQFQCSMEDVLYYEIGEEARDNRDLLSVYYSQRSKKNPYHAQLKELSQFDPEEWRVESYPEMSEADMEVFNKYVDGLSAVLDQFGEKVKVLRVSEQKKCLKEIRRIKSKFLFLMPLVEIDEIL